MATNKRMAKQQGTDNEVEFRQLSPEEEHELAEELYRLRHDPDEWEDEPSEFVVDPNFGIVYSVRFTREEFREIEKLAERKGVSIDRLIKDSLLKPNKAPASMPRRSRRAVRT